MHHVSGLVALPYLYFSGLAHYVRDFGVHTREVGDACSAVVSRDRNFGRKVRKPEKQLPFHWKKIKKPETGDVLRSSLSGTPLSVRVGVVFAFRGSPLSQRTRQLPEPAPPTPSLKPHVLRVCSSPLPLGRFSPENNSSRKAARPPSVLIQRERAGL